MPQLRPCTYEEDDATLTVTISLPAAVTSNQLTVTIDVNSVAVELMGVPTALTGKLFAPIRPHECTWQIERTQSAEVEPGVPTSQQACAAEDALVLTIVKATPSRWTTLFVDNLARRRVPPATDPSRRQLPEVNKNVQPGLGFVPRKLDLDGEHRRESRRAQQARGRDPGAKAATLSAREFWPSARAVLLWRDGQGACYGELDHPSGSPPLYSWVEDASSVIVRASTARGLSRSALELHCTSSSVDVRVRGVATPWCAHLTGKVDPARCSLDVVPTDAPDGEVGGGKGDPAHGACDTLQLTLTKARGARLWRAPFLELLEDIERRERRERRPRREELHAGGYDMQHTAESWTLIVPYQAGVVREDDLRVALTSEALSVYVAGQEDAPILAGELGGRLDTARCGWRVRASKSSRAHGTTPMAEIVITLVKAEPDAYWSTLFKAHYV